jgi:hypothetical protein
LLTELRGSDEFSDVRRSKIGRTPKKMVLALSAVLIFLTMAFSAAAFAHDPPGKPIMATILGAILRNDPPPVSNKLPTQTKDLRRGYPWRSRYQE